MSVALHEENARHGGTMAFIARQLDVNAAAIKCAPRRDDGFHRQAVGRQHSGHKMREEIIGGVMTGKQIKAFAAKCNDDAVVEVRERSYGAYADNFEIRAIIAISAEIEVLDSKEAS